MSVVVVEDRDGEDSKVLRETLRGTGTRNMISLCNMPMTNGDWWDVRKCRRRDAYLVGQL